MSFTRRTFLKLPWPVLASTVLSGRTEAAADESPEGDVVGKVTVGYQGWFACDGDGAPIGGWWHWSEIDSQAPTPQNNDIRAWPDVRDYFATYPSGYANLGTGSSASLFSSYDQETINLHFSWMSQYGCDTAALQRFNPTGDEGPMRDAIASKVRFAAETFFRKFFIMYDVSVWLTMQEEIKKDWSEKMSALTGSSAYARQNDRPVVGIWGFGFRDSTHPWSAEVCLDVINWFKQQGCYVIGGVPSRWRAGIDDSRPGFLGVYQAFDMLSPWMVGRIGDNAASDDFYENCNRGDVAFCEDHGIDYQPCVLPGDLLARQRVHGDFMWHQFYNMVRAGARSLYITMFDEFNEGNQIIKTAESAAMLPADSGLLALDEDGTACSADYYLRLTMDGGRMLKGELELTPNRPTGPLW